MKGYLIKYKSGRRGNSVYKTRAKALRAIRDTIKNNSLETRQQVGAVGMTVVSRDLYDREVEPMKRAKDFIRA